MRIPSFLQRSGTLKRKLAVSYGTFGDRAAWYFSTSCWNYGKTLGEESGVLLLYLIQCQPARSTWVRRVWGLCPPAADLSHLRGCNPRRQRVRSVVSLEALFPLVKGTWSDHVK